MDDRERTCDLCLVDNMRPKVGVSWYWRIHIESIGIAHVRACAWLETDYYGGQLMLPACVGL